MNVVRTRGPKTLWLAMGACQTCNEYVEQVGSSPEDAKLLLRHAHGSRKHLFGGDIDTKQIDQETARAIEKRRIP